MRILSLDTSFSFFNFSIIEDGKVSLIHYLDTQKKTLENLPKVLSDLCIRVEEFDAFAVSVGVGYLTSLRIGVTFVKTTAYLLKKPVVSYENLHMLCRFTPIEDVRVPFLKVSTNLFYRVFDKDLSEVRIYRGENLEGTGISLKRFADSSPLEKNFLYPFFPFSAYGGLYAHEFLEKKPEGENLFEIEPLYLKPPV
ncbi:MAG: tRNA threonylcarbamoyladenosine biosynthesis protein TsaB [Aquificae bacterium]|nr:tRNA threonylcarbamoyladenosine biosynthesis protein TsaB [Aquificota bacterium]